MAKRTANLDMQGAPREERIRQLSPALPGYFVVYYDVRARTLLRRPILAWGVREREEWRFQDGEQSDHILCDFAEAMVPATTAAEIVFASDLYDVDDQGNEVYRTLGIGWEGDGMEWEKEMEQDAERLENVNSMRMGVERRKKKSKRRTPKTHR